MQVGGDPVAGNPLHPSKHPSIEASLHRSKHRSNSKHRSVEASLAFEAFVLGSVRAECGGAARVPGRKREAGAGGMDDWDADDFEVPTLGLQDQKRFDDEDEELEDAAAHPKQKPQKPTQKAKKPEKGPKAEVYVPLDDPEAEKRRRQR